jgi:hypothetical protein
MKKGVFNYHTMGLHLALIPDFMVLWHAKVTHGLLDHA